jgi:outer membrane protein assembly factor BamB
VIALVGGKGAAVVAFDKTTGKVKWKAQDFENSYSTPRIMKVDGKDQLVTFMATEIIGMDPANGDLLWSYSHQNQWKQNVNMPVMADGNHIFFSSPEAGARGLKLTNEGGKTKVEELWSTRKIQFYHVTSVRSGDWVYGSTGATGPAFMAAVNIRTGDIAWRERGMAKANVLGAGDQLVILDEDGKLYLATASPEGLEVAAETQIFDGTSWTVPTVTGKTMYLRDKKTIVALDLS